MNLKAIILAAGKGSRFYPLSKYSQGKEFLPIYYYKDEKNYHAKNNGTPIIAAIYKGLKDLTDDITVVLNPSKNENFEKLKKEYNLNVKEEYKTLPLGDASALDGILEKDEIYIIHYGDLIYNSPKFKEDIQKALEIVKDKKEGVVFLANKVFDEEEVKRFGVFYLEGNKVKEIYEKPKDKETINKLKINDYWLVNSGIYVIKPNEELIKKIKEETKRAMEEYYNNENFNEAVMAKIISELNFPSYIVEISDYKNFEDLGTFEDWIKHWSKHLNI